MVFYETTAAGAEGFFPEEWERCVTYYGDYITTVEDIPEDIDSQLPLPVFFGLDPDGSFVPIVISFHATPRSSPSRRRRWGSWAPSTS